MKMRKSFFVALVLLLQTAVSEGYLAPRSVPVGKRDQTIRIMSYNVENLFDTLHDPGKSDGDFLPKGSPEKIKHCQAQTNPARRERCLQEDWNKSRFALKLNQVKKVFSLVAETKPAIVGLVEVENQSVVKQLAKHLGYQSSVTTNSPDERGIDVALMYNESRFLKFVGATAIRLSVAEVGRPTRDILEVAFKVLTPHGTENFLVYVNHWPSQGAPVQARIAAAKKLSGVIRTRMNQGYHIVVLGDFNVIDKDQPTPFGELTKLGLVDVDSSFRQWAKEKNVDISGLAKGSYYFGRPGSANFPPDDQWNLLDRFFVSKSLFMVSKLNLNLSSYRIFNPPVITTDFVFKTGPLAGKIVEGVPDRYDFSSDSPATAGFSDHFPILVDLVF
jgi:exonuclease III